MKVALKLKKILLGQGYRVVMTKSENSVSLGNVERAEIGNKENAALVIRIHADSSTDSAINGASMLVPAKINSNTKAIGDISLKYGKIILNSLVRGVGMKNNGVVSRNDMTGFNWSKVPVVLVETGFLSNEKEDKFLSTDAYQNRIAAALASGIKTAVQN
jgi:N-acetylmuramoyl-L-alanine amidase